ncbi:4'-phosphopantetheinyl transferase family protein [Methyloglobulus sp.]|uniref:4'-phosphopantetheinyl transferase family protein n=1 Tax=Methyloglobulus sp. TaxID=2518622 RepID=UPI003988ED11
MDSHTIKLWQGDCETTEVNYLHYWRILDPTEQQHVSTIKNEQLHRRYVEIHARLRILLGHVVNAMPEQLRIHKTEYGKPYLADYPELVFNLSHTANKMVVAIANNYDLGIDIELCKPRTNLDALVDKCFAEEEKSYWQQLPENEKTQAFFRFWTRKEAFVKATGKGIALGLKQCVINPLNQTELLRIPQDYGQASEWFIQDIDLGEFICCALAAKNKGINHIERLDVSWNSLATIA